MTLARGTQKSQGITDMCFVPVPHPLGMIPVEDVIAKVNKAYDNIVTAATAWKPAEATDAVEVKPYPARRTKFTGDYAALNEMFSNRKWSLSLPIIPPTVEKVKEMLKGTKRDPAEVVWIVPPREGILTVELVAVYGVMAGAKPEHMPLLLAAIEAMKEPSANWRGIVTTTASTTPVFILSGPMTKKLGGMTSGTGTSGAGNPTTNALGYFVNLVGYVIGGAVPPDMRKSTHGVSGNFVAQVFVENDEQNPWKQSYAVEQGFAPTDDVVTFFGAYLGGSNVDHSSTTGESLLNTIIPTITGNCTGFASCFTDPDKPDTKENAVQFSVIFLCPEHAQTIFSSGFDKQKIKEYLVKNTVLPFKSYAPGNCAPPASFGAVTPDTLVPRYVKTKSIHVVVTGGAGKQTQVWSPFIQIPAPTSAKVVY